MKTIYVCGPTLYSDIHIGNARSLVFFDVVAEYYRRTTGVRYARNITDVDDKIVALCGDKDPADWVTRNTLPQFRRDEDALGVKPPDVEPRASEYIDQMIALIGQLGDAVIRRDDGVYFDPSAVSGYGSLSNRDTKTPFALWKFSATGWSSPYGFGRPGWHTECVAMILSVFGGPVDIHGGGSDLIFPHHENENCQCVKATGRNIARDWLHVGQVMVDGKKMSKSLGNVMTIKDLSRDWSTGTLRTALLMTRYGKPINMSAQRLHEAEKLFDRSPQSAWLTDQEWPDEAYTMMQHGYVTRY